MMFVLYMPPLSVLENSNGVLRITAINCQVIKLAPDWLLVAKLDKDVWLSRKRARGDRWRQWPFSQTESNMSSCFPSMSRGDI